jgi:hypothetical protein
MAQPSLIYISSNSLSGLGPWADNLEVLMLLTPNRHSFYAGETFSQDRFDSLKAIVLNKLVTYCKTSLPRDYNNHDA